ncbi:MAG TPA: DUF4412 domain-containing protein [Candidatus Polarisedimenticolia bacterium]|jgi:hypothetical protein|nr:DUF4412 domain-containing protein [Candidatus Polarisedimenticolia bacterium]
MKSTAVLVSIALALSPALAFADLTLKGSGSGSGLGMSASGETAIYIKGGRMRSDWTQGAKSQSMILDLDHQRMIVLDHAKKKAEVFDLAKIAADLKAIPDGDMKVEIKPTGKTRSILGRTCQEFLLRVVVPYADPSGMSVDTILSGPAWIAKDSPGASDYRSFYLKAAEKGLFFNHPAAAKAQPGRAKGTTALYKELAKLGVPYASDIRVDFQGTGLLAQMMSKMGEMKSGSTVSQVSTAPLPDHLFEEPAGYKIKAK